MASCVIIYLSFAAQYVVPIHKGSAQHILQLIFKGYISKAFYYPF